jgi:hypothetical protein
MQPYYSIQAHTLVVHKLLKHGLGLVEQFLGLGPHSGVIKDAWVSPVGVAPSQLPYLKNVGM